MTLLPGQSFRIVETLFTKLLGAVYLIAFASLWPQILGLVGASGVAPAVETMSSMRADYGWRVYLDVPSLFWFAKTDWALEALCALGCLAALFLLLGVLVRTAAVAAYVLYLSLVAVGQPFTGFQWDALLLEVGFLAIFAGSPLLPLAFRFLLFRLMFESGLVKLTSNDVNWRNLHALRYHFYTQPLPTPAAYYAQQTPNWLLDFLTLTALLIELLVPFFVFVPWRQVRRIAVGLLILLQVVIAVTGNYAFFNLLTIALCLWGLDDGFFDGWKNWRLVRPVRFPSLLKWPVAGLIGLGALNVVGIQLPFIESLQIVNPYGLFAVMTTSRTELVVEGSDDGMEWKSYSFRYKPGDVKRGLPLVAPYQPRLDWQMWFAALGRPQSNPWVQTLVYRLLLGEPEVLHLLEPAPFKIPPRTIRIQAYDYSFSTEQERRRDGIVWRRTLIGSWSGPLAIKH
jgi:hypothetical protein